MAKNIEIKAILPDVEACKAKAEKLSGGEPEIIQQEDIFFNCDTGRLKLRMFSKSDGELIFYQRPDQNGPKTSEYQILKADDPLRLKKMLEKTNGSIGVVKKTRRLYITGRTRIHIDKVEGLGDFIELEVVLAKNEDEKVGEREAKELMKKLGIKENHLIDKAYIDLLINKT